MLQMPSNKHVSDGREFFLDLDVNQQLPEPLPDGSPIESTKATARVQGPAMEKRVKKVHSRVRTGCATCR